MKIIRSEHMGMCFGVRDAIALARAQATEAPITVLGDLVHNEQVLGDLRRRGVRFERDAEDITTANVMITAHGASERVKRRVRELGHNVIEATCPLVRFAHDSIARLAAEGFHPVIIGKRDHVEVRGLTEDLPACDVILNPEDIERLKPRKRFGVAAQTTQPLARVRSLVEALQRRFPDSEVRFVDTVCGPTKQRQAAAAELARKADVVVVVGGSNSNNTRELAAACGRFCERVHHVQTADDLSESWFNDADTVGITAGTSTPAVLIDAVEERLAEIGCGRFAESQLN